MVAILAAYLQALDHLQPVGGERGAKRAHHAHQRTAQRGGVGGRHALEQVGLARQRERLGAEGGVERAVVQQRAEGGDEGIRHLGAGIRGEVQHHALGVALRGVPAVAGVGVVRHAEGEARVILVELQDHRRREAAQQRGHRLGSDADEAEGLLVLGELEHARAGTRLGLALELQRQIAPVRADEADRDRDHQRLLDVLAGRRRGRLRQRQRVAAVGGVPHPARLHPRGASLLVPAHELVEVEAVVGLGHHLDEVVAGHRLAVEIAEVEVHAVAEALLPQESVQHADDLGALLVHRGGVEVVDLLVAVGADRVRHRPAVLRELRRAQHAHVVDALDRARRSRALGAGRAREHVGGELLVAEDGEAFLEGELEPVAAGDAVARPVVEVLVRDHALDVLVVEVGGGVGLGEDELGVEDVQPLVLHRAHVEVGHRDDHEAVEVELQAEGLLVPAHRVHQRIHRVLDAVEVALLHPHLQQHLAARQGGDAAFERDQLRCDQREEVRRLGEGILPLRVVAALGQQAFLDQVAVGEQHRAGRAVGFQRDGVARHHVGAVGEAGDAAEALGLTLGEEASVRQVEARQRGVGARIHPGDDLDHHAIARNVDVDDAAVLAQPLRRQAVHGQRHALERLAPKPEGAVGGVAVAHAAHAVGDQGGLGVEAEVKVDGLDRPRQRPVVGALDRRGMFGFHYEFSIGASRARQGRECTLWRASRTGRADWTRRKDAVGPKQAVVGDAGARPARLSPACGRRPARRRSSARARAW